MHRIKALTVRNLKETVREPMSLIFCAGFPLVMLVIIQLILGGAEAAGTAVFQIDNFAPGIAVFGYTFTMLFVALGISSDKNSAFMTRIFISPLSPLEYYLSFVFAFMPVCLLQTVLFYAVAFAFGLNVSVGLLISLVYMLPSAFFYIACGLFIGTVAKSEKSAGPASSVFICATGMLGGVWLPVETLGGVFLDICKAMPFYNTVKPAASAVKGMYKDLFPCVFITLAYTAVLLALSALIYKKKRDK